MERPERLKDRTLRTHIIIFADVQLTDSAKGQLTESAGVVDVDDDFSWC